MPGASPAAGDRGTSHSRAGWRRVHVQQQTLDLLACYYRLTDPKLRRRVLALLEATVAALEDTVA